MKHLLAPVENLMSLFFVSLELYIPPTA